jgi:hypothetical protein
VFRLHSCSSRLIDCLYDFCNNADPTYFMPTIHSIVAAFAASSPSSIPSTQWKDSGGPRNNPSITLKTIAPHVTVTEHGAEGGAGLKITKKKSVERPDVGSMYL